MEHSVDPSNLSFASAKLKCQKPNRKTIRFLKKTRSRVIAEVGVYEGATSMEIARHLDGKGVLYLFDFNDRVEFARKRLAKAGFTKVRACGCTSTIMDSYNWPLMKLLKANRKPIFDYVFIDGAHSWAIDGFAFLLIDRLLKPNGFVDFDDYNWSLAKSRALNPTTFPQIKCLFSDEQIKATQVKLIVDLLVRRDDRYREVVRNRVFQKMMK